MFVWLGPAFIILFNLGAAALAYHVFSRSSPGRQRRAWGWLSLGMLLMAIGVPLRAFMLIRMPYAPLRFTPLDATPVLSLLPLWAGLLTYPRRPRQNASRLGLLLDALMITAATFTCAWLAVIAPSPAILTSGAPSGAAFYPLSALLLHIALSILFILSDADQPSPAYVLLVLGLITSTSFDLLFVSARAHNAYQPGSLLDLGWMAGSALVGLAAFTDLDKRHQLPRLASRFVHWLQLLLPLVSTLLLGSYALFDWSMSGTLHPLALWVMAVLAILLVARQGVLAGEMEMRQLERLNARLEQAVAEKTASLSAAYHQLELQNRALKDLDALKSEFVTLVSHELRAPLTNIRGGIELLLTGRYTLPRDVRANLELVQTEISRLGHFVETILDVSALDAGQTPLHPAPLDLFALATALQQKMASQEGAERLQWLIPQDLPPALADDQALASILLQLVDNALKYAAQGKILISAGKKGSRLFLRVEDEGAGIPERALPHLFESFYRPNGAPSNTVQGRGLGLYIARRLLEAMGGSIEASNRPGGGAAFTCWLPYA